MLDLRATEYAAAAKALREAADVLAREVDHEVTNARAVAFLYRRAEIYERFSAAETQTADRPRPPDQRG